MGSRIVNVNMKLFQFGVKDFVSQTDAHEVLYKKLFL